MKYLYIDTETTGLNPKTCAIHQLSGIVTADGLTEEFNLIMAPHDGAEISFSPHPYTDFVPPDPATFKDYPSQDDVYLEFKELLKKYVDPFDTTDKFQIIGYNVQFDMDFLRQWFIRNGDDFIGSFFWFPPIDVMYLASIVLAGERHLLPNFRLSTVYEYVFPTDPKFDAHDALADIRATKKLLGALFNRLRSPTN